MEKKAWRLIYDPNYYKAKIVLKNPKFRRRIQKIRNDFARVGCPIPKGGFRNYKEFYEWLKKVAWPKHSEIKRSKSYQQGRLKIAKGKDKLTLREYDDLRSYEEKHDRPFLWGLEIDNICEDFGINKKDKGWREFLTYHIFLHKEVYPTTMYYLNLTRNKKTGGVELWLRIFPHTKKEDICNHWDLIKREQEHLPKFVGKSKEWKMFERDLEIYTLYQNVLEDRKAGKIKARSVYKAMLDNENYFGRLQEISKRHRGFDPNDEMVLRSIISRCRRVLGRIKCSV